MNKQEFIRDLNNQAGNDVNKKCLVMLLEKEISASTEIATDKSLDDVFFQMREYAHKHKSNSIGCCPPDKAIEIALDTFGLKKAPASNSDDIDIMSLL